jgi:uncharacterized protein (TIGR03083 family)
VLPQAGFGPDLPAVGRGVDRPRWLPFARDGEYRGKAAADRTGRLLPILRRTPVEAFDRPTVCTGWTVRDVLAHCGCALTRAAEGRLHRFTPELNQIDVDERRPWPLAQVLAELEQGYGAAAAAMTAAGGELDGLALGEWIHGGDVREALGEPAPYQSEGVEDALLLLVDRSRRPVINIRAEQRGRQAQCASRSAGTCAASAVLIAAACSCAWRIASTGPCSSVAAVQCSTSSDIRSCSSAQAGSRQGTRLPIV